ncbi:MAG: metallophosphoesterase family protein [Candidatus Diapherotrites archaeon]|nr:metallophosphoesterase family protein [Candidatus Diapherotrites archaeon]
MVGSLRILALSDIHQRVQTLKALLKKVNKEEIDLVVVAGDLTNYGDKQDALELIDMLNFSKVFAVPGNLDTPAVLEALEKRGVSLHNKCIEFRGLRFCGFGAGLLGSVGAFLYSELDIEKSLKRLVKPGAVLITHLPPKNTKIDFASGEHIGSSAVKKVITERKPLLNICGHVHEAYGKIKLGSTTCVNVAAVKEGRAWIIDLDKNIAVKRLTA